MPGLGRDGGGPRNRSTKDTTDTVATSQLHPASLARLRSSEEDAAPPHGLSFRG